MGNSNRRLVDETTFLRGLFEQAPGLMAVLRGPEHVYELANAAYLNLIGRRDIVGKTVREVLPELGEQGILDVLDDVYRSGKAYVDRDVPLMLRTSAEGPIEQRHLDMTFQPILADDGSVRGIFVEVVDMTERVEAEEALRRLNETLEAEVEARTADLKRAEETLRQAQKMEAVGQLTGGIAHDFNNLLQGIVGSLHLVQKRIEQGRFEETQRFIAGAMTSANRAAALTHRLLAFSRRQPLDPKPLNLNPLVISMEDLLRRTSGEEIEIELKLGSGLWPTFCDQNQLESAILNLAINARDAMPAGGKLTIETANREIDAGSFGRNGDMAEGQYVCLSVGDTGVGMPAEIIERAFDPFFTTKPIGQGTGLGLSMIYGFIRQSEGHVALESQLGRGTTVRLYLPRHRGGEPRDVPPWQSDAHRPDQEKEVVLVVEDEPVVRDLVVELLNERGYRTLQAEDGPEGLRILLSAQRVDLLVSDIGLPGLNGRQVADAARKQRPDLRVLFMTGYAQNATLARGVLDEGMELITKPFELDAFTRRVQSMIEQGRTVSGPHGS